MGRGSSKLGNDSKSSTNIMSSVTQDFVDSYTKGVKMHYGLYRNLSGYDIGEANLQAGEDIEVSVLQNDGVYRGHISSTSNYDKNSKTIVVHTTPEIAKAAYMKYTLSKTKKGTSEYENIKKKYSEVSEAYSQYKTLVGKGLRGYYNKRNPLQREVNTVKTLPKTVANKSYAKENTQKINSLLTSKQASIIKKSYYDSKNKINSLVGNVDFTKYK